jgi:transmembrane sensor
METVKLRDGSVVTLARGARIAFEVADGSRKVTLLGGEATFHVAKDKAHPFVVRSGDVYAQATGTVYSVNRIGNTGGAVHVTEGSVLVWARDERDQAVLLRAGGRLSLDPGPRAAPPAPALPPPELAQISLNDVPVSTAVARFNRVNHTQIVIADPAIGDAKVIGLFRADDPHQFARAVAALSNGSIIEQDGIIVIKSK